MPLLALVTSAACGDRLEPRSVNEPQADVASVAPSPMFSAAPTIATTPEPSVSALDEEPEPDADQAAATGNATERPSPIAAKTYRAQACYYGALSLKQSRAAYLASLGGAQPSPKRIPEFGASPPATGATHPRGVQLARLLRHCNVAVAIKHAEDAAFDPVASAFAEFGLPLAKLLESANQYYLDAKFNDDGWKHAQTIHACLTRKGTCETKDGKKVTNAFALLDTQLAQLKTALDRYEQAHPVDRSSFSPSQAIADRSSTEAMAVLLAFDSKPIDISKATLALGKLEVSRDALARLAPSKPSNDPWVINMIPHLERLVATGKTLAVASPDAITPVQILEIVALQSRVLQKNYTSLQASRRHLAMPRMPPRPAPTP